MKDIVESAIRMELFDYLKASEEPAPIRS